ncbi:hypothetical protein [Bradyrhizobium sp. SRL28]|nr:hypothetical protein [Bradyrhizobium sp. SRL28]
MQLSTEWQFAPWQQQSKKIISSLEQEGYWKAGLFDEISALRVA